MTDLLTDLLIYIGFGIIMSSIGTIIGHQVLKCITRSALWCSQKNAPMPTPSYRS